MDDIIFYQPPLASKSRPHCPPGGVLALNAPPGRPTVSPSNRQIASQLTQQNGISRDQIHESQDVSDLPLKGHALDRRYRNNTVQEQDLAATRNSGSSDNNHDFLQIDELLSGTWPENMPASADPIDDDADHNGLIDIDELLAAMKKESVSTSVQPNSGHTAEPDENGTRGSSPTGPSRSTAGSSQDPIILSHNESAGVESETDYSHLEVDVRAKSNSDPPHIADSELADGNSFGSGAVLMPNRPVTDHQDDENDHDGVIDKPQLRLSVDRPRPASPDPGSDTDQGSKLYVNTGLILENRSFDHLDGTEGEGEGFDVSAEGDKVDPRSTRGPMLSAVSDRNPASGSNISGLRGGQPDGTQSPQLPVVAASSYQSGLENDRLPKRLRRGATTDDPGKRPRTRASIRLASDDEDYTGISDAAGSKRMRRPHSRKRVRRTADSARNDMDGPPPQSLDVLCQAAAVASPSRTQESDKMPIHGYFTLKTVASKVVYCLTFSQELLPHPQYQGERQESSPDLKDPQSVALDSGVCQASLRRQKPRLWTREEDATLRKMKKKGRSWEDIHAALPHRSKGTLQVRYSTKLKD